MSPDSDNDGRQNEHTAESETRTEADEGGDETGSTGPRLSRRGALLGTGLGLLLGGAGRTAAAEPGQRWKRDVDADGNALLDLGGLNTEGMPEDALIADFEGSNLEIADASLNVTDHIDVDTARAREVTAEDTVSTSILDAGAVDASEGVQTPELDGGVTGGESIRDLVGNNLSVVDNRLTAIDSWQGSGGLLRLGGSDVEGIEVGRIESPESEDLNVESDDDLVLSVSGGQGAVRIETDGGHEIVLSDGSESLSVEDGAGNSVEMDSASGEVSISASEKITLDAPTIELSADVDLNVESDGNASLVSSGVTDIKGALVQLNGPGNPAARAGDSVDDETDTIESGSVTVTIG